MLKKFEMDDAKAISTPMGTNGSLDSDASGNMVDQKIYRSMIGSLLYVTASRQDVMFSMCMCAGFQASPRESHLKPPREYRSTGSIHKMLDCGIPKEQDSS